MNKSHSYNRLLILGIALSLLLVSSFLNIGFSLDAQIDEDDGVYFLDTFEDGVNVNLTNCELSSGNGKIILDTHGSSNQTYDFSTWSEQSENKAYSYETPYFILFFPPGSHVPLFENELSEELDYNAIKSKDGIMYPLEGFAASSPLKIVHHFRLKINQDVNSTTQLNLYWCGKAENDQKITMYYWQPLGTLGMWEETKASTSNATTIELQQNFTGDLFISEDNYVDLCIIVTPDFGKKCSLYTDYVKVTAYGQGNAPTGTAISAPIAPQNISRWGLLTWEDYEESGTSIKYHILYENGTDYDNLVEETYLNGNEEGFSSPPVFLESIPAEYKIKIKADLTTNDLSASPEINSWGITWQTQDKMWRDLFNFSLRVDEKHNMSIANGDASVILSINDWPMFGQNSANTRSSDGYGPDADNHDIYWYSTTKSGSGYRNPVIKEGILYIASLDGSKLYAYDATVSPGNEGSLTTTVAQIDVPENALENSPAVSNDNVIIATGTTADDGKVENKVYAFDTNTLSENPTWIFEYSDINSDNPYICYSASPTVSNNKIFLSSWSGDSSIWNSIWKYFNFSIGNNKLIALDSNGNLEWEFDLPAGSFSSPAVYENIVIVCCERINGNSLFAIDANSGEQIWSKNVGPIGRASPVIYEGKVFVVAKEPGTVSFTAYTKVVALNLNDGAEVWNVSIGDSIPDKYKLSACSTPTIYNDVLFVASSDGTLYALDTGNGEESWSEKIYTKPLTSAYLLTSSPAYADGLIYIGTPDGILYAIDASDGSTAWNKDTYQNSAMLSSPVVVDGLIYYTSENGMLFSRGKLQGAEGEQITGNIVSIPIRLPDSTDDYVWDKFHETSNGNIDFSILDEGKNELLDNIDDGSNISTTKLNNHDTIRLRADFAANTNGEATLYEWSVTFKKAGEPSYETVFYENSFTSTDIPPICTIDVQNEYIGLWNTSAKYKFEYENQSGKYTTDWLTANCSGINGSKERETITANISYLDFTENITQYWKIRFSIKDIGTGENESQSEWHDFSHIEYPDVGKPIFYNDSFTPKDGWISTNTPICTIDAQDKGTEGNITGLNIKSAEYTLEYKDQSGTKTYTEATQCSGTNGTTSNATITADISKLDFSENITELQQIRFYIEDMAGNGNYSKWIEFKTDAEKPSSWITNTATIPNPCNTTPVTINATAEDDISGVKYVELYYQTSGNSEWSIFNPTDNVAPYTWGFSIGRDDGGEYELCTIATDNTSNVEDYPSQGDVSFIFDPNDPYKPIFENEYQFTNDTIPEFSIEFKDDYKLKSVEYRLSFDGYNEWTKINDEDINGKSYTGEWNLTQDDRDYMLEDVDYYIYFRLTDSLGNQYKTSSDSEAMKIIKNLEVDVIETPYDPDLSDFYEWHWGNVYNIAVDVNESNVTEVQLWYRYSSDNRTWSNWTQYEDSLNASPFEWNFAAEKGNGHYEFKTKAWDTANQYHESAVKSVSVTLFPTLPVITMIIFTIILIIVSTIILTKIKKKKT